MESKDLGKKKKLNNKDINFISIYMSNGQNGADAYRKAYSTDNINLSKRKAYELLREPLIKEEIERQQEELKKKYDINKEDIIRQHIDITNSNFLDYYNIESYTEKTYNEIGEEIEVTKSRYILKDLEELTLAQKKNIKQIKMTKYGPEIILYDRVQSLQELSKILGFYDNTVSIDNRIDTSSLSNLTFEELEKLMNSSKDV